MSWQFYRQLGIGERQHIRTSLLGVAIFGHDTAAEQIRGAVKAANELGMMLRAHVNGDRVDVPSINKVQIENVNHQVEIWRDFDEAAFGRMCSAVEILIAPGENVDVQNTVHQGILTAWKDSGGRFLNGNFALKTDEELRKQYPQFYHDPAPFWKAWTK